MFILKVEKIEIQDFRIFKNTTVKLGTNLTCISGHNGVGKSTLLAILGNIGELKKELGTHINGNLFRGEFSDIVHGDKNFDRPGEKCTIYFSNLPTSQGDENPFVEKLGFRSTFQKINKTKKVVKKINTFDEEGNEITHSVLEKEPLPGEHYRYRLLPVKTTERNTESKLSWPTYYLGLSRLYPIGESTNVNSKNNIPTEIMAELLENHKNILTSNQNYVDSSSIELSDAKKKKGFAIKTDLYSEIMNSSGQDNLGQILLSVYSFQILKQKLGSDYNGGLLLIDEIDATLHPVAQNKLIDFLEKKSEELNLQVVFTTHSLSLLNHITRKQELSLSKTKISLIYLTNKRSILEAIENPTINYINNDLMNTYSGAQISKSVPIFTEDEVGRWFMRKIVDYDSTHTLDINFIEMYTSWTHIIKLFKYDYMYFKNFIVALDPDISQSDNYRQLQNLLIGTRFSLNKTGSNILILPGDTYIEKMFWDYVSSLKPDDAFFYDYVIEQSALNLTSLINEGPFSTNYQNYNTDKDKIKSWFKNNLWVMDRLFDYWVQKPDNEENVAQFINKLIEAYNPIYYQRR